MMVPNPGDIRLGIFHSSPLPSAVTEKMFFLQSLNPTKLFASVISHCSKFHGLIIHQTQDYLLVSIFADL